MTSKDPLIVLFKGPDGWVLAPHQQTFGSGVHYQSSDYNLSKPHVADRSNDLKNPLNSIESNLIQNYGTLVLNSRVLKPATTVAHVPIDLQKTTIDWIQFLSLASLSLQSSLGSNDFQKPISVTGTPFFRL